MATIGGLRTTYEARKEFAGQLQTLFEKIEDLNRPTPMTEGEYLEFANLVKSLHAFGAEFQTNEVFVALIASAGRAPRVPPRDTQDKANCPLHWFCKKCDTFVVKKHKAKHLRSERCKNIHNSKCIASRLTRTSVEVGKFSGATQHPFYLAGQVIQRDFLNQKQPANIDARVEEFHQFRLPSTI